MSFRETLHRYLLALERGDARARLFATPLEICEGDSSGYAVVHLLYCENPADGPVLRRQSHLTLVFQEQQGAWVRVHDHACAI